MWIIRADHMVGERHARDRAADQAAQRIWQIHMWLAEAMIEQTITVGNLIEITVIAAGGLSVFITLRNSVGNLKEDVSAMQSEIKKLAEIITQMAVTDLRLTNVEQDIRELRHGRGFVQGERGIDREFP